MSKCKLCGHIQYKRFVCPVCGSDMKGVAIRDYGVMTKPGRRGHPLVFKVRS